MENKEEEKEYFLSTIGEKKEYVVYQSENFKLSEIDLINLIKICLIDGRSKKIGNKLLSVYRDSTQKRKHITLTRLKQIGLKEFDNEPTTSKNVQSR